MKVLRSFATGTGVISFPKRESDTGGNLRSNCGTPTSKTLVFSGLISREFWQHRLQISLRSSFKRRNAQLLSTERKERYSLLSST